MSSSSISVALNNNNSNNNSNVNDSNTNTVPTHTLSVGLILPPPDIRAIVDKTAAFVATNGVEFEERIIKNEKNNNKFR